MRRRATAKAPVGALSAKGRSRLLRKDVLRLGASGLKSRPTRVVLSALGIAIGIAAMIAVVGISTSSQAKLNDQLSSLGTNMLTVGAGKSFTGDQTKLPTTAAGSVSRLPGVEKTAWLAELEGVKSYRNRLIDPGQGSGITGVAVADNLLDVTEATLKAGNWFNEATSKYPTVILGATAAQRLGVVSPGTQVWIHDQLFTVLGILDKVPLAPELDTMAMFSEHTAINTFGWDKSPTSIYERSSDEAVEAVRALLPRAANPESPRDVEVSRPSDALAAKNAADTAFTGLLVGLGAVALLVGGIGVANTMVISVLERRREIGLRRALGATRKHIRSQFLAEALLLSALGGVAGVGIGMVVITVFAHANGWPVSVPPLVILSGVAATIVIGAIAGLYPAIRAARTPPTAALAS